MITTRLAGFTDYVITLLIQHAHLETNARVDADTTNYDRLVTSMDMAYPFEEISCSSMMQGLFNYGAVYQGLRKIIGKPHTKPLEMVLDTVLQMTADAAADQGIDPSEVMVTVHRQGLVRGDVQLRSGLGTRPRMPPVKRSAGMAGIPLALQVDHSAWPAEHRLEHVDVRHEHVTVDFYATFEQESAEELGKLLNYADVHNRIQQLQGHTEKGPIENVVQELQHTLEQSAAAQRVPLTSSRVVLHRHGYLYAKTYVGLERIY